MRLPVCLPGGATGWTRDVSTTGVFVEVDRPEAVGTDLQFSMRFENLDLRGPIELRCEGTIVRVEGRPGAGGMAVALRSYGGS